MRDRPAIVGISDPLVIGGARRLSPPVALLFLLAVGVLYTVSGGMLWLVGYNYEGITGSAVTKIHPGSYLVFLAFLLALLENGDPIGAALDAFKRRPACLLLFLAAVVVFMQIVSRHGPGMAGVLDSFLLPSIVVLLYGKTDEDTRRRMEMVIHLAMLANAVLGLAELATHHVFFPFRFDGEAYELDTRSAALQGHPLGNATVTAYYVMALMSGGGRFSPPMRLGAIVLQLMAMVAFGGRVALVTTVIFLGVSALVLVHRTLRSNRIPLLGAAAGVIALTLVPIVILGLYVGGFFDAILVRFATDGGSANARVEMIHLLGEIPLGDLIVGPDAAQVDSLRRVDGLELGIENPIVRTLVYQGALVTGLLMIAVGLFLHELTRWSRPGMMVPILGFVIIINTFESLASKSTLLAKFAIMMLVLYRPLVGRFGITPKVDPDERRGSPRTRSDLGRRGMASAVDLRDIRRFP